MFLKAHLWGDTEILPRPVILDSDHREGVELGTPILINLDTVADIVDTGNTPPGVRITFKREEARGHLDIYGSVAVLARRIELAGIDGSHPIAHLRYATFED